MVFRSRLHANLPVFRPAAALCAVLILAGCQTHPAPVPPVAPPKPVTVAPTPPSPPVRHDDEIIVAGKRFHTGTSVVTWLDQGGYNAYRQDPPPPAAPVAKRPAKKSKPAAKPAPVPAKPFNVREIATASGKVQPVPPGDLATLQKLVDQFVLHYDGSGVSRNCFTVLRQRGLSVHFLLDVDGTIYQTLDLEERALHATIANDRSVGIEIANVGAHPLADTKILTEWYRRGPDGGTRLVVPKNVGDPGIRTWNFQARPARDEPILGRVQGLQLEQYDYTPEQYAALSKLIAALCRVFPRLVCDYPRDRAGQLIPQKLPDEALAQYHGVLGHYHVQANKQDPGPALQWDRLIDAARVLLK